MELVTEPVIHDAETAGAFARELQLLLRTLKISSAHMERGEMRVEANISVSATDELGTKVEVKNLNSFKSVEGAIAYEISRQIDLLEKGEAVAQETRGWDEVKLRTFSQRSKETAKDYRYFPDPDIPKVSVAEYGHFEATRLAEIMPELPQLKRIKYEDIGLPNNQIELLITNEALDTLFGRMLKKSSISDNTDALKLAANYLTSDTLALLQQGKEMKISSDNFARLIEMLSEGKINSRVAKDLLAEIIDSDTDPVAVANERGLLQSSDPASLQPVIDEVLAENPTVVADYKAGKEAVLQFLVGQGMKKSRGTANPGLLADLLKSTISRQ
jgi:aspartyl-tRNA(Asn)/glutamyl-tRNA(Gln) amidotransferase subunit B